MKCFVTLFILCAVCSVSAQEWTVYTAENSPLPSNKVLCVAVGPDETIWIGTIDDGLVKFSGGLWTVYNMENSPLTSDFISVVAFHQSDMSEQYEMWVGTPQGVFCVVGESWKCLRSDLSVETIDFDSRGNVWIGTDGDGMYRYNGETWVNYGGAIRHVFDATVNDTIVWVCAGDLIKIDGSERTVFDGFNENTGVPQNGVRSVLVDGQNVWCGTSELGLFMTRDENKWINYIPQNSGLPSRKIQVIKRGNGCLWIGTTGGLVKFDGVDSWTIYDKINSPLVGNDIQDIDFSGNKIIMAVNTKGIVILAESTATATTESPPSLPPTEFELFPNFPNPFNRNTIIRFNISEKSHTTLILYNILGQQVQTILSEELEPGAYTSQLSGDNLTSGTYFTVLSTDTRRATKKLTVLK